MEGLIDDEMLHAFAVVAPLEEIPERVAERCAGIVDRVSFISRMDHPSLVGMLK
jgi:hypothetical protein